MRFYRHDTPTIMDGLVVRYRQEFKNHYDGEVSASRNGVLIRGNFPYITTIDSVLDFQKLLTRAREQFAVLSQDRYGRRIEPLPFSGEPDCVFEQRKYRIMSDEYEVIAKRETEVTVDEDQTF